LLNGSPAVDAGDPETCLATDQRGIARPQGEACDIGAFEGTRAQALTPVVHTYRGTSPSTYPGTFLCDQTQPACTNGQNAEADAAHRHALLFYDFLATRFGRHSIDDNNMPIISTVQDSSDDNSWWYGSQLVYGRTYGYPFADDIVGTSCHGITQYEPPGSIISVRRDDESLADVFGELFDQEGTGDDCLRTNGCSAMI
jgi:Zn-dependent metalloprotease